MLYYTTFIESVYILWIPHLFIYLFRFIKMTDYAYVIPLSTKMNNVMNNNNN